MATFFGILMAATSLFLILLVLVQRGRGGGLAGALGGMGGQSAFGTKAGDTFTRVTIGVASFWIVLCVAGVILLRESGPLSDRGPATPPGIGTSVDEENVDVERVDNQSGGTTTDGGADTPAASGGGAGDAGGSDSGDSTSGPAPSE